MRHLFTIIGILSSIVSMAQDVIVKKDGSTILAKVTRVGDKEVEYKKYKSNSDRLYSISTSSLIAINYEDGEKDTFSNNDNVILSSETFQKGLIEKSVSTDNSPNIRKYNDIYDITKRIKIKNQSADHYILIYGVQENSVLSNSDLNISFSSDFSNGISANYIKITNKTTSPIYIDRGNCFKVDYNGENYCYFDPSYQTSYNSGGTSSAGLGLGAIAGVLGVGGKIGQIANGVSLSRESSNSINVSYQTQRILSVGPNSTSKLTDYKEIETKKNKYEIVEIPEVLIYPGIDGLLPEKIKRGSIKTFTESESPQKIQYLITYSTDPNFSTYSTISFTLYLHQIIGVSLWANISNCPEYISNYDSSKTIVGFAYPDIDTYKIYHKELLRFLKLK